MVTIGQIPRPCTRFFNPVRKAFTRRARDHFWTLVLAITLSHGSTIDRLAKLLRGPAAYKLWPETLALLKKEMQAKARHDQPLLVSDKGKPLVTRPVSGGVPIASPTSGTHSRRSLVQRRPRAH